MVEINESDIIIQGDRATWTIRMTGDINGLYSGTFTFKTFLSPLERIAANREYRELVGEHAAMAAEQETFMAYALTQLKYRIVKAPPFWATETQFQGDIPDEGVISHVLDAAVQSEVKYRKSLKKTTVEVLTKALAVAEKLADSAALDDEVAQMDKNTIEK